MPKSKKKSKIPFLSDKNNNFFFAKLGSAATTQNNNIHEYILPMLAFGLLFPFFLPL